MTYSQLVQRALAIACFVAPPLFVVALGTQALQFPPTYILTPVAQVGDPSKYSSVALMLAYFAHLFMIPALFTLTAIVGQRAPRLALASAIMGLLGLGAHMCLSFVDLVYAIATQAGLSINHDFFARNIRPEWIILLLPNVLYFVATFLLGVAVWRTGVLPRWVGALLFVAGPLLFDWVGPQFTGRPLLTGLLASLCLLVVYAQVGSRLWRGEREGRFAEARGMMVS